MVAGGKYTEYEQSLIDIIKDNAPKSPKVSENTLRKRYTDVIGFFRRFNIPKSTTPTLKWLQSQRDLLFKKLKETELKPTSKANLFTSAAVVSRWMGYTQAFELFSRESTERTKVNQKDALTQKMTPKQADNWLDLPIVQAHVRKDLLPAFRELVRIGKPVETDEEKYIVLQLVAGWLSVFEPPARNIWDICVFNNRRPAKNLSVNVLQMPTKGPAIMHVNNDKNSSLEFRSGNLGKDSFPLSAETTKILAQSLDIFPRIFILSDQEEQPSYYNDLYFSALSTQGKRIGKALIRVIYTTWWYSHDPHRPRSGQNPTPQELELARRMRHSWKISRSDYLKITGVSIDDSSGKEPPKEERKKETKSEPECPNEFEYSKSRQAIVQKKYYNKHRDKEQERSAINYQKNKDDTARKVLIKQLNLNVRKAKQETIDRYNLRCVGGKWE
jgi:hypothetical protein